MGGRHQPPLQVPRVVVILGGVELHSGVIPDQHHPDHLRSPHERPSDPRLIEVSRRRDHTVGEVDVEPALLLGVRRPCCSLSDGLLLGVPTIPVIRRPRVLVAPERLQLATELERGSKLREVVPRRERREFDRLDAPIAPPRREPVVDGGGPTKFFLGEHGKSPRATERPGVPQHPGVGDELTRVV